MIDILKRRKENYRNVKLQYEVGRENRGSLLLSQYYVEQAEYDLSSTEHQEEVALEDLRRVLGLPLEESITLTETIERAPLKKEKPDFAELALRHPDVIIAQSQELSALYDLRITGAQFLPSLDFSGSYSYGGSKFFPDQDSWRLGLTLSIPIFDGLRTFSSYRSQMSTRDARSFSGRNSVLKTASEIKKAYYEYIESLQKEKIDEGFSQAAALRAEVARNKYKNGFLFFEEWDQIESDLISRQKEKLSSERNRIIKQAAWEEAQNLGVF